MDLRKYFQRLRLDFKGKNEPTLETLITLQNAHLLNIPFENLDIHRYKPIDLKNSFDKIIIHGRGGFCYELNGIFYEFLKMLGFKVKLISARVFDPVKGFGPEFDHMAILATINNTQYLVDVGFGEFIFSPLKMEYNTVQADPRGNFIIGLFDEKYIAVKKENETNFIPEYIFTKTERALSDFYEMCNYHQFNSESHFTHKKLCSLPTEDGRITVSGNRLKITSKNRVTESEIKNEDELKVILLQYFNIKL